MRVLLLGATGNLGRRLVPALIAHHHVLTILVRYPAKLTALFSPDLLALVDAVVEGDATDSTGLKSTIIDHNIEAIVDVAGNQVRPWEEFTLPKIAKAVTDAAVAVGKERGRPMRAWVTGGLGFLKHPPTPYLIQDYFPTFAMNQHDATRGVVEPIPLSDLRWSLLGIAMMLPADPKQEQKLYVPIETIKRHSLVAEATSVPDWRESWLAKIPLIGVYMDVWVQGLKTYATIYEDVADFLAEDLELGNDRFVGAKVGLKQLGKKDT